MSKFVKWFGGFRNNVARGGDKDAMFFLLIGGLNLIGLLVVLAFLLILTFGV